MRKILLFLRNMLMNNQCRFNCNKLFKNIVTVSLVITLTVVGLLKFNPTQNVEAYAKAISRPIGFPAEKEEATEVIHIQLGKNREGKQVGPEKEELIHDTIAGSKIAGGNGELPTFSDMIVGQSETEDLSVKNTEEGITEETKQVTGLNPVVAAVSNHLYNTVEANMMENNQEQEENNILQRQEVEYIVGNDPEIETKELAQVKNKDVTLEKEAKKIVKTEINQKSIMLSPKDKQVLLRIVEAEATGEDIRGRILVANVILNRVKNDEFPNSITDVVFQHRGGKYQFSPISDKRYWKVTISEKTEEAIERVLEGEDYSQGALYFMARKYANPKNVVWFDNQLMWLFKHGVHEFYK